MAREGIYKTVINALSTHAGVVIVRFVASVLLARILGPELRGELAVITTSLQIIQPLSLLMVGANDVLLKSGKHRTLQLIVQSVSWMLLVSSFLFLILLAIPAFSGFIFSGAVTNHTFYLFLLFNLFSGLELGFRLICSGFQKFGFINKVQIITVIIYVGLLWVFLENYELGVNGALLALTIHQVLMSVSYLFISVKSEDASLKEQIENFDSSYLKESLQLGFKAIFTLLPTLLLLQVDVWILKALSNNHTVGLYQVNVGLCMMLVAFSNVVKRIFRAKSLEEDAIHRQVILTSKIMFAVSLIYALIIVLGGKFIFTTLYGKEYTDCYSMANILVFAVVLLAVSAPVSGFIMGKGKYPTMVIIGILIALALNIGLNYALIPEYGGEGAALASVISYFVLLLFYFRKWKELTKISAWQIFLLKPGDFRLSNFKNK